METQPQTATAGSRSNGDMAQNIQQLTQAGIWGIRPGRWR